MINRVHGNGMVMTIPTDTTIGSGLTVNSSAYTCLNSQSQVYRNAYGALGGSNIAVNISSGSGYLNAITTDDKLDFFAMFNWPTFIPVNY